MLDFNFTLIVQMLSFVFFIGVFHRYIWVRLMEMVDSRRTYIEQRLQKADEALEKVKAFEVQSKQLIQEAKVQAEHIINQAKEESEAMVQSQVKQTQLQCEALLVSAKLTIEQERKKTEEEIQQYVGALVKDGMNALLKEESQNAKQSDKWQDFFISQVKLP